MGVAVAMSPLKYDSSICMEEVGREGIVASAMVPLAFGYTILMVPLNGDEKTHDNHSPI